MSVTEFARNKPASLDRTTCIKTNLTRPPLLCVISIGDFGIVALFGNETFRTLPFYLYQQIGAYTHKMVQ